MEEAGEGLQEADGEWAQEVEDIREDLWEQVHDSGGGGGGRHRSLP